MTLKWGSTTVTAVKWGSTTCTEVYWGSTLVFPDSKVLLTILTDYWTGYNITNGSSEVGKGAYSINSGNSSTNSINTYAKVTSGPTLRTSVATVGENSYRYRGKACAVSSIKVDLTGKTSCTLSFTPTYTLNTNRNTMYLVISTVNTMEYSDGSSSSNYVFKQTSHVVSASSVVTCSNTGTTFSWTTSLSGSYYIMIMQSSLSTSSGGYTTGYVQRVLTSIEFS